MTDYGFKTTDDVELDGFGLPAGTHKVMIVAEEVKETEKDTNPRYLSVSYEIVEGDLKGKQYFYGYNLWNKSLAAVKSAQRDMRRIADATGKPVSSESPLKGRVFNIIVEKDGQYSQIKRYLPESEEDAPPFE